MPEDKDRDQLTPAEPEDAEHLARKRGQGTGGSGVDLLPDDDSASPDRQSRHS